MHATLIDSSHILRVILLVKAPISTSPTWNEEEILINKDLERFLSGCMPVIGLTVHVWSVVYASSSLVVPTQ